MTDSEVIVLFRRYQKDFIVSALYTEFQEINSSLDSISIMAENDPKYLKMKEEAKLLKRKLSSTAIARFSEIETKRKINVYATLAFLGSFMSATFTFYQAYNQQVNSSKMKNELFSLVNEQIEQSSQEIVEKIQNNLNTKIDETLKNQAATHN